MTNAVLIFLAGGCGSVLRYLVGLAVPSALLPWATLMVNALGSFAIGLFGALAARFGWSEGVRLALTVGLCGGFTTFSTFSREALDLASSGRWCDFSLYIAGSVILGIAAAALGFICMRNV